LIASHLALPGLLIAQGFQGSVLQMIATSGPVAKTVLVVLLGFSFLSWSVMIERYRLYRRALRESREFLDAMEQSRNLADLRDRCDRFAGSPLVSVFKAGFRELTSQVLVSEERRFKNPPTPPAEAPSVRRLEKIQRVLDRASLAENERLEAFLPVLATTGSVTPFVGLFGTVWGIMNAFQKIGVQGSASLGAVAPGISEALITTAAGLAAAIPAVIGYNYFLGRLRQINFTMDDFAMRFGAIAEQHLEGSLAPGAVETGQRRM
jgi:biopolymer transport protein TolQ